MSVWDAHKGPFSLVESIVGALFAGLAVAEYASSADVPHARPAVHVAVAVVACLSIGTARRMPVQAAVAWSASVSAGAILTRPAQLFGVGCSMIAISYLVGHGVDRRQVRWLLPLILAVWVLRDARDPLMDASSIMVDLAFIAVACGAGVALRLRSQRASALERDLAGADARTIEAIEAERARLARELHEIVAHAVSVMVVQAGTSRPRAARVDADLAGVLETIETTGREALVELRRLLGVLRGQSASLNAPVPRLDELQRMVDRIRQSGLDARLTVAGNVPPLSGGLALCVLRVVQEGLTNALRYAPSSTVDVEIAAEGRSLVVTVTDDGARRGVGDHGGSGMGLIGLRERVTLFGGTISAAPHGPGYQLRVTLPLIDEPVAVVGQTP